MSRVSAPRGGTPKSTKFEKWLEPFWPYRVSNSTLRRWEMAEAKRSRWSISNNQQVVYESVL